MSELIIHCDIKRNINMWLVYVYDYDGEVHTFWFQSMKAAREWCEKMKIVIDNILR